MLSGDQDAGFMRRYIELCEVRGSDGPLRPTFACLKLSLYADNIKALC